MDTGHDPANEPDAETPSPDAGHTPSPETDSGPNSEPDSAVVPDTGVQGDGGPADDGAVGSDDPEFDACMSMVTPVCVAKEMDTAERMEVACKAVTNIPIPLTSGGMHGPITLTGGPYAARIEWNEGMGTPYANEVNLAEEICVPIGIDTFMEPQSVNDEIKNLRGVDWGLYTIFRPACFKKDEKYPVITWANGTCGEIAGYSSLLSTIASHGYVVIAANSTWTNTAPTNGVQLRALDYAEALNEDPTSPLYQKLDMEHIGAMGHSQGAAATGVADDDPRVLASIYWNKGTSNEKPFLNVSGERDTGEPTVDSIESAVDGATKPGAWVYMKKVLQTGGNATGHLTLMEQPERVIDFAVAWWDWQLKGSEEAKKMFVGDDCGLCTMTEELDYGHNTLLK